MKKTFSEILICICLLASFCAVQAQTGYWNLVWREDFGVVEDTVIRDFPDDSKKLIDHTFAGNGQDGECSQINDMYYGIVNSTKWAIKRPKSCNKDANWFTAGRDHTGNENGGMLLVNVGNNSLDKQIYEQTIDFDLCQNSVYRFVIYASSITHPQFCDNNPTKANLTMNVYNVKNPTPVLIKTFETSDIPLWELPLKDNGDVDWGETGQGFYSPFAERAWSQYQVEFTAGDGDKLKLEVVNHKNGGCGNDFVIDDISLYRYDVQQVIDPTISINTISQESTTSASGCVFLARFSVPTEVLDSWKDIYSQVYFLWQRSRDDGYTWINMPEPVSGIDKNNIEWEVPTGVREVYRVIITGSTTDVDAKSEAEYIALHGGPSNGCSYYSISNTLAGVSPEPDCSYKDNLKTIWKEDFGVIDKSLIRANADVKLNPFTTPGDQFNGNDYIITSDPYTAVGEQTNPTCYYDCFQRKLTDFYSPNANDAVLYSRLLSGGQSTVFEKVLNGPFCNCKAYIFSFKTLTLNTYTDMFYAVYVKDAAGNILAGDDNIKNGGEASPSWKQYVYPFEIPINYNGNITVQVIYKGNQNWNVPTIFDDFEVKICQEKVPQASLAIDNNASLKYLSNFDCAVTPPHMVNLNGLDAWASEYPNYGYVWQMSVNGGATWTTISESARVHYCDDLEDGETLYRVVVGENATVAQQVATNGKPNDACATYFITNMVGLNCKGVSCTKPAAVSILSTDDDDVLCPDGSTTLSVSESATVVGTFDYLWFKDEIGTDLEAVAIAHDNTSTAEVQYADAGTYVLLVRDATYPTAQKCWQQAEIELTKAEAPVLKSITGGDEFCYGTQPMPQVTYTFDKGEPPYKFKYRLSTNGVDNDVARTLPDDETTFSPVAPSITNATIQNKFIYTLVSLEDSYGCMAPSSTLSASITVNPVPSAVIESVAPVCEGSDIPLKGSSNITGVSYRWTKGDARTLVSESQNPILRDVTVADAQTYYLTTKTIHNCVSIEASKDVVVYKQPVITEIKAEPEEVCSGNDITFSATVDNVGEGDPSYSWTGTSSGSSETLVVSKNVTAETTVTEQLTYTMKYTTTLSCSITSEEITATIHKIPDAPDVSAWSNPVEYCIGAEAEQLSAVGENLTWYLPDGTTSTVAPTPLTNEADKTVTYQVTQTVNNCESPKASITVTVHPLPTPVITASKDEVCSGTEAVTLGLDGVTYVSQTWTGANVSVLNDYRKASPVIAKSTAAGTYTFGVTVVDEHNCEASAAVTKTITFFPKPTASVVASESGICNLTATDLIATVSEPDGTGVWTNADETSETSATFTASAVGQSTVKYVYTSIHGCKSDEATATIQVYAIPAKPIVANKHPQYCMGKTAAQLLASTASQTATLTWFNSTMDVLPDAPTPTTSAEGVQQFFVKQTDNGCTSDTAKIEVTVFALPNPTITASADAVCKGSNINLSTEEYSNYVWNDGGNGYLLNAAKRESTLNTRTIATTSFTVGLVVTDENNCSNVVPVEKTFTIYPIPEVTISAQPSEICNLTTTDLTATVSEPDGTGEWTNAEELTETTAKFTASQTGTQEISYVYTSKNNCVSPIAKTNIVVNSIPVKPTVADKQVAYCVNATAAPLTAMATTTTASLAWFDGEGNELAEAPTPTTAEATTFVYGVKQIDNSCASDTAKITVVVHPLPEPVISVATNSACKGTPVQLSIEGVVQESQMWTYMPSSVKVLSDQSIAAPILLPTTPVETYTIRVEVTDKNNCKNTSEPVTVTIHPIPTASISIDDKVCEDGELKTATVLSVEPAGGSGRFSASGSGVIDETTGVFDPQASGAGDYTISYEYTAPESEGACTTTTPATATISVLAKPTLTLLASKNDVCESGVNSNPVTMTVSAIPENGTATFSCETTTIDASTGTLTPSSDNIGPHEVTLTYIDENNCRNEVSTTVTVHSLPQVEFLPENPSEICVKADPITLAVSPTGPGTGAFSGVVLSSTFNPAVVGSGNNHKVVYKYTDEYGCVNSVQHTISVVSVTKPTIVGGNSKMIVRGSDGELSDDPNLTAEITTTGDGIVWQRVESDESTETDFITGLTKNSPEDTYSYMVVESREIEGGTCFSDVVTAHVVISDCPAKTPLADNAYTCVGDEDVLTVTATPADGVLASGNKISWFDFNPTGSRDENAADAAWDNKLSLQLIDYDKTVPSERIVYVAEYDSEHGCWSGGRPVTIKVIANPVVTFEAPEHVCVKDGVVNFKVTPVTGSWTNMLNTQGFDSELEQWNPAEAIGTKTNVKCVLQYAVNEKHIFPTKEVTCRTIVPRTITAHAIKVPSIVSDEKTWLIDDIEDIPDDFMSAQTASTGKIITWYDSESKTTILNEPGTNKSFTPNREELQLEAEGKNSLVKSYWVSQTDNYGCESDLVEVKLHLLDCPWTAPVAQSVVACQFDETVPALTASTDVDAIGDNPTEWIWYDPDGVTTHSVADDNGSSSYNHGVTAENESVQNYFVSYKAKVTSVNDRECESPKTPVSITINKAPDIKMNDTLLCYADGSRTLSAVVNGVKSTGITEGSWLWNIEGKTGGIDPLTGILDPAFEDDEQTSEADRDHSYQVTYSYTDTKNCSFEKTVRIDVEYAQKPQVTDYNGIVSKPDPVIVTAENIETSKDHTVNWFYAKSAVSVASNDNPWQVADIDPTQETTRSYWVSQTVNGCESERVEQKVAIVDCPYGKPNVDGQMVCVGGTLNEITATTNEATPAKWVWYNGDGAVISGEESNTYHHSVSVDNAGTTTFFVSYLAEETQSGELCESQKAQVSIVVLPLPTIVLEDRQICYNEGNVLMDVSQLDYHDNGPGSGVWSVENETSAINSTSGIFRSDFKERTSGEYTVIYTYKDGKECENSASMNLTVQYVPEPVLTGHTSIVTENLAPQLSAEVLDGAEVNWFNSELESFSSNHSLVWNIGLAGNVPTEHTFYASQTFNGCESEKTSVDVLVVECPFTAPTIEDVRACVGDEHVADLEASTTESVQEWQWFTAEKQKIVNNTASLSHQVSASAVDTVGFYVNYVAVEPVTQRTCPSDSAYVRVIVLPLPEITFDEENPSVVCYDQNDVIFDATVDVHKNGVGAGSWSIVDYPNAMHSSGLLYPSFNGKVTDTYTVKYNYADAFGCTSSAQQSVLIRFVPTPSLSNHYALVTENRPVVLEGLNLEENATMRWYAQSDDMRIASSNNPWTTPDKGSVVVNKTYYASQFVDGCESERNSTTVEIIPCPVPNVTIESASVCVYESAPELHVSLGEWANRNDKSVVRIYDSEGTLLTSLSPDNLVFTPTLSKMGTYSFYAEEYNAQPQYGILAGCASPVRAKSTVVVKDIAAPTLRVGEPICFGDNQTPECVALGVGELSWFEENPGDYYENNLSVAQYAVGTKYNPTDNSVGTHPVWVLRYDDGCYSKAVMGEYTVKPRPEPPTTEGDEVCYTGSLLSNSVKVTSEVDNNSFVTWYLTEDKKGGFGLAVGSKYVPYVESPDEYTYYAAVTTDDCEGATTPATLVVKPLPQSPQIVGSNHVCTYDEAPTLKALGENITWYASDKTTVLTNDESLEITDMTPSTRVFYISQTLNGCEGPMAVFVLNVNPQPSAPKPIGASICAGNKNIPTLSTNLSIDKWYADEDLTRYLTTGYTYTPDADIVGNNDVTFYVVREQRSCVSETVPVTLRVIQKPTFSIGDDTIVCVYDSALTIQATDFVPPITESSFVGWSITNGKKSTAYLDNEEHKLVPEENKNPGEYVVKAFYRYKYDNVSCNSDTISMKYTIKKRARKPIVFTKVICHGEEIKDLQALGSPDMTWNSLDNIAPATMRGPKYKFTGQQMLDTGTYRFEIFDIEYFDEEHGCVSERDTISLTVAPGAKTKLFGVDSVCVGATESYYTQYTPGSIYYWDVKGDNLIYSKDAVSSSVRYVDWTNVGYDTLSVYEQTWAGCEGFDTLFVKVASKPVASFSWSIPGLRNVAEFVNTSMQDSLWRVVDGDSIAEPITYSMLWNFGHQNEASSVIDAVIPYEERNYPILEEDYSYGYNCPILTIENSFGCKDTYTECFFINSSSALYVPDVFAPANPALGVRTFAPQGFNLKTCEVAVYDHWGNMLWYSNEVRDGMFVGEWDGRYNGKMMESGVYVWRIDATFIDGKVWDGVEVGHGKKKKYGNVILLR